MILISFPEDEKNFVPVEIFLLLSLPSLLAKVKKRPKKSLRPHRLELVVAVRKQQRQQQSLLNVDGRK